MIRVISCEYYAGARLDDDRQENIMYFPVATDEKYWSADEATAG